MTDGLFVLPAGAVHVPAPAGPTLSADRRRTQQQKARLTVGLHPLQPIAGIRLPLHAEAAPASDRRAPGRRCGNCAHREVLLHHGGAFPKCWYGDGYMATHSAASDCRGWWPACNRHVYAAADHSADVTRPAG